MPRRPPPPAPVPLLLALVAATGCGPELQEGRYDFVATAVLQDTCSTEGPFEAPADIEDGTLSIRGETVLVDYERHGAVERLGRAMQGRFLPDREVEQFIADATFDVYAEMGPDAPWCLSFMHAHLHGVVDDPTSFHGELRFDYTRRPGAELACASECVLELAIEARRR